MHLCFKLKHGEIVDFRVHARSFSIGRSQNCDIVLPYDVFSRKHCLIEYTEEQFFVTDTDSANGVFINDEKVEPGVQTPFHLSDRLVIGDAEVTLGPEKTDTGIPLKLTTQASIEISGLNPRVGRISNPVAARARTRSRPRVVEAEKKPLLDPLNILLILLMGAGFLMYKKYVQKDLGNNQVSTGQELSRP